MLFNLHIFYIKHLLTWIYIWLEMGIGTWWWIFLVVVGGGSSITPDSCLKSLKILLS